jgi:hypothetical protein
MDFTDLQMTFTVVVILTAAAVVVFFDHLRKHRQLRPAHPVVTLRTQPLPRPTMLFVATPMAYAPAKKLVPERALEPLVPVATSSRPPVEPRERETVTVQMAPSSPTAPSPLQGFLETTLPAVTIDAALWERLISSQPKQNLLPQPIQKTSAVELLGMVPKPAFEELLERNAPFTGLVVSIGINDSDSSMWHSQGLMPSVGNHLASLLTEKDFACRMAYDEFVLVCREQGAQGQRRLNQIAERLWDYQLRGIGTCSILFSWGGVQVQDQPFAEAVASATERMRDTQRIGQSTKSVHAHLQAV